jgi:hypothetical protein
MTWDILLAIVLSTVGVLVVVVAATVVFYLMGMVVVTTLNAMNKLFPNW